MNIQLENAQSEFLENICNKIYANDEEWYYMPFWFKKVEKNVFEQVSFDYLPKHVKDVIFMQRWDSSLLITYCSENNIPFDELKDGSIDVCMDNITDSQKEYILKITHNTNII